MVVGEQSLSLGPDVFFKVLQKSPPLGSSVQKDCVAELTGSGSRGAEESSHGGEAGSGGWDGVTRPTWTITAGPEDTGDSRFDVSGAKHDVML